MVIWARVGGSRPVWTRPWFGRNWKRYMDKKVGQMLNWSDDLERYVRQSSRSWCRRFGVWGEDAEDLEQDSVVAAFERVRSGRVRYREGLWLMCRGLVLNFLGKPRLETVHLTSEPAVAAVEPGELGVWLDELEREFPELLPLAEARAQGYEWEVIAEAYGVSAEALRAQWSRLSRRASARFLGSGIFF